MIDVQFYRRKLTRDSSEKLAFHSCLMLNISSCEYSEGDKNFVVTVYNPSSHVMSTYVRIPVTGKSYLVTDYKGTNLWLVFEVSWWSKILKRNSKNYQITFTTLESKHFNLTVKFISILLFIYIIHFQILVFNRVLETFQEAQWNPRSYPYHNRY